MNRPSASISDSHSSGRQSSTESAPERSIKNRRDIDGLRAVAVLAIILFHAFPSLVPGGFIGVDIFFVISGYLITSILIPHFSRGSFSLADFYARRVRRIFPALAVVLIACGWFGWYFLIEDEYQQLAKHTLGAAFFVANFLFWGESGYFDTSADSKVLLHLWSLGIEEQFYLVYPVILFVAWRRKLSIPLTIASLGLLSFVLNIWSMTRSPAADFFLPQNRAWELMVGALLASVELRWLSARDYIHGSALTRNALSILGACLLAAGLLVTSKYLPFPGWLALLPTLGAFALIAAGPLTTLNRVILSNPLMVWTGRISFSLYLWHWPLLTLPLIITGKPLPLEQRSYLVASTFALAGLTYLLVENPMRFGRALRLKTGLAIGSMTAIATAAAIVYLQNGVPGRAALTRLSREFQRFGPQSSLINAGCAYQAELPFQLRRSCILQYRPEAPTERVVVWGDSHARAWSAPLLSIAQRRRYDLTVLSFAGCPPIGGVARTDIGAKEGYCWSIRDSYQLLDTIISLKPDLVILAARWPVYARGLLSLNDGSLDPRTHLITSQEGQPATQETSVVALRARLPETIQRLRGSGASVVVINSPPIDPPIWMSPKKREGIGLSLQQHRDYNRTGDEILSSVSGLAVVDPANKLCADGTCVTRLNGVRLYIDDNHLTDAGSSLFEEDLLAAIVKSLEKAPAETEK